MSRATRNSWDAMLPSPSTSVASTAGSSTSTAAPSITSFPSALVQQIVDAVKASLAAENTAVQPSEPSSSGELQPVTAPLVQAIGGVPSDLSSRSAMLLDSGGALSSTPSTLSGAPHTGTHLFAVPSFVNTFSAPVPSILPSSSAISVVGPSLSSSPLSANSTFIVLSDQLSANTISSSASFTLAFFRGPWFFSRFPQKSSARSSPGSLWT